MAFTLPPPSQRCTASSSAVSPRRFRALTEAAFERARRASKLGPLGAPKNHRKSWEFGVKNGNFTGEIPGNYMEDLYGKMVIEAFLNGEKWELETEDLWCKKQQLNLCVLF
jgi:hypothetical protein